MMSFQVYILHCADGSYYTGHTDNLEKRIGEHNDGALPGCYTFKRRPVKLVFSSDFPTRDEALASELQIKVWSRKKKEAMIRGDWAEVSRLAKSVRPEPITPVCPDLINSVCPEPRNTVRPEPVEGHTKMEEESSVHPSTSSGRTEGEAPR